MEERSVDEAPIIVQDGYNFPRSWWICWNHGIETFVILGASRGEKCPTCGEALEYQDGILVSKPAGTESVTN